MNTDGLSATIPSDMPPLAQQYVFSMIGKAHEIVAREQHPPYLFLFQMEKNVCMPILLDLSGPTQKARAIAEAKHLAKLMGADLSVLISEAWSLSEKIEGDPKRAIAERKKYGNLANHPERVEVLFVTVQTKQDRWLGRGQIYKDGKRRTFSPVLFAPSMATMGHAYAFGSMDNFLGVEEDPE